MLRFFLWQRDLMSWHVQSWFTGLGCDIATRFEDSVMSLVSNVSVILNLQCWIQFTAALVSQRVWRKLWFRLVLFSSRFLRLSVEGQGYWRRKFIRVNAVNTGHARDWSLEENTFWSSKFVCQQFCGLKKTTTANLRTSAIISHVTDL